jgi:hypothetical protein
MWQRYRQMLIPTQVLIVAACVVGYFWGRLTLDKVVMGFAMMQVAAVLGAWWAARIKRQIEDSDERLPLE